MSDPENKASRPGRLRSAVQVLLGQRLVPAQIQAEWLEYQLIFGDLLQRQSAMLARAAKEERKRLRRLSEHSVSESPPHVTQLDLLPPASRKAALRSQAADRLGLGPFRSKLSEQTSQEPPQVEERAG